MNEHFGVTLDPPEDLIKRLYHSTMSSWQRKVNSRLSQMTIESAWLKVGGHMLGRARNRQVITLVVILEARLRPGMFRRGQNEIYVTMSTSPRSLFTPRKVF